MSEYDLVLNQGTALVPDSSSAHTAKPPRVTLRQEVLNIGVKNGKIAAVTSSRLEGRHTISCQNLVVMPGVIDSQVHFREPGMTHKEDLASGSKAAALGGVTSFFEMPNTLPPTTSQALLEQKLQLAAGRSWVNYAFFAGASNDNIDQLARLESHPSCPGIKVFMGSSTGNLLVEDDFHLKRILQAGRRRVIVHCEDEARLRERKEIATKSQNVANHPVWRDEESAVRATTRLLRLARECQRPVHVLHVSTEEELELLAQYRDKYGDLATVEALPQHLTFAAAELYDRFGTLAQQNPPIRASRHREALWRAINSGLVNVIGSDHAPHSLEEKAKPYPSSPSGMPMVQTLLPLMLNHVSEGRLNLLRLAELVCENPRHVFGCASKGRIEVGLDADFTVVDLQKKETIRNSAMASRSGWTVFDGLQVQGWPVMTIVGGQTVMQDGQVLGSPTGRPVEFQ